MSHTELQESLSQKFHEVKSTITDFGRGSSFLPPLKDASSMTDTIPSVVLVHSSVQACKRFNDVGCQCDPQVIDNKAELVSSKSSYYSLGGFSYLRRKRSYSDSEYTLVPDKSCEALGKDTVPGSESGTTVMLTPVASFSADQPSRTVAAPNSLGGDVKSDEDIPRSNTRIISVRSGDGTNELTRTTTASALELTVGMESSEEKVRKYRRANGGSAHKCMWQQQVKTFQQRQRSSRKQVC